MEHLEDIGHILLQDDKVLWLHWALSQRAYDIL
jgi:hypothetical protein